MLLPLMPIEETGDTRSALIV